jgi:hypothetical protein
MEKWRLIITITIIACLLLTLQATHMAQLRVERPLVRLEREMDNLRAGGIPVADTHLDMELQCLVVEFDDMEPEYVEPVREIVGYEHPILFRELEEKKSLIGHPPAPILDICRALIRLFESGEYYGSYSINFDRGLLHLDLRDLDQGEIERISSIVGDDVPIEFEERPWRDRLYIGSPSYDVELLENISRALSELDESIEKAVSGTSVDEKAGHLRVSLYKHRSYPNTVSVIREALGPETPALFVFYPWEIPRRWNQTSPSALLNDYASMFELPDLCFEITRQNEDTASANVQFLVEGNQIPFQSLELNRLNSTWYIVKDSRCKASSPSRQVEIVGYLLKSWDTDWKIFPIVKNAGNHSALITSVIIKMENSTHTFNCSYTTGGMDLKSGLIGSGGYAEIPPRFSCGRWRCEQTGELASIHRDSVEGQAFQITLILMDGEEPILTQRKFNHVFEKFREMVH